MGRVRRRDGDKVDAVAAAALAHQHLPPIAIGALGRDAELLREGPPSLRIGVERAGREIIEAVERRAVAVRGADLTALAAANQAPVQLVHSCLIPN